MQNQSHTLIGVTKTAVFFLYAALAIIGFAIGYFIPQIAKWALSLPWIPLEGPLRLITFFSRVLQLHLSLLFSVCVRGFGSLILLLQCCCLSKLTDHTVEFIKGKKVQTIHSDDIALVFMDHKRLVLLGTAGYELVREEIDEKPVNVEKAFRQHHYEWATDGDPFKDQFRRWIPDAPDLSQGAHALLKARHKALQDEEKDDIEEFRLELAQLGIVVRDEGTRQYWRKAETYPPKIQLGEGL